MRVVFETKQNFKNMFGLVSTDQLWIPERFVDDSAYLDLEDVPDRLEPLHPLHELVPEIILGPRLGLLPRPEPRPLLLFIAQQPGFGAAAEAWNEAELDEPVPLVPWNEQVSYLTVVSKVGV